MVVDGGKNHGVLDVGHGVVFEARRAEARECRARAHAAQEPQVALHDGEAVVVFEIAREECVLARLAEGRSRVEFFAQTFDSLGYVAHFDLVLQALAFLFYLRKTRGCKAKLYVGANWCFKLLRDFSHARQNWRQIKYIKLGAD